MTTVEGGKLQRADQTADIPVQDAATIPPDEGDIGSAPPPGTFGPDIGPVPSPAITPEQAAVVRSTAVNAAALALRHADLVHYTQGARRWDGINRGLIAANGGYPNYADCSSFATWCLWNGMRLYNLPDTVNGQDWHAGFTGTMLEHGTLVTSESDVLPGDLALYGDGPPGQHVAICVGGGLVISHGSEGGPYKPKLRYRRDLFEIRRYISSAGSGPRGVAQQQRAVNALGYTPALEVDGRTGPKTSAGIKWLQKKVGAAVDGEWGPETEAKYLAFTRR